MQKLSALQSQWYRKLKESGFKDIEDSKQRLKHPDTRTITWQSRELVLISVDSILEWLSTDPEGISPRNRAILEMYCEGEYLKEICKAVGVSRWTARRIIKRYTRDGGL